MVLIYSVPVCGKAPVFRLFFLTGLPAKQAAARDNKSAENKTVRHGKIFIPCDDTRLVTHRARVGAPDFILGNWFKQVSG